MKSKIAFFKYTQLIIICISVSLILGLFIIVNASPDFVTKSNSLDSHLRKEENVRFDVLGIESITLPKIDKDIHVSQMIIDTAKIDKSLSYILAKKQLESEKKATLAKQILLDQSKQVTTTKLTYPQNANSTEVIQLIRNKFGVQADNAIKVATCESGLRSNAVGDAFWIGGIYAESIGIFQIRLLAGRPSKEWLMNANNNVDYAYNMWKSQGWGPWSCAKKLGIY